MTKIIDLSVPLENDKDWAPWWARNRVKYQNHRLGAKVIRLLFGVPARLLPDKLGWANENLKLSSHGTTHMDAPWHYAPTCNGLPAKTIDEVPLDWCFAPGVKLDLTGFEDGYAITVEDLEKTGVEIEAGNIVLIHTGNDKMRGTREYFTRGVGMSAEATHWLIDRGVRVMGIDGWGWDIPLPTQAKQARESIEPGVFWSAHYVGLEKEYCQLERLTNLDQLPTSGFKVSCFPLKVKGGSAGPARVVAIFDEESKATTA
jgi:kynurenine formamidase